MKTLQPNFEKIKSAIYNQLIRNSTGNTDICVSILINRAVKGDYKTSVRQDIKEFISDLDTWLDSVDIRQAGSLIDKCVDAKIKLPEWIKNKRFTIEYNKHSHLDLIKN